MDAIIAWCGKLWKEATDIWLSGGWGMIAIAVIALVMFGVGMNIRLKLKRKGFLSVPEKKWRKWIDQPHKRRGPVGKLLDEATLATSVEHCSQVFEQLRLNEIEPFRRDLMVMKICVSTAPLVGLLGTVTGMLATFDALSGGNGGEQTMDMIAGGISEALITTETGLVIALPGLFFQYQLVRHHERYKAFLAHLETVCTQSIFRRDRNPVHEAAEKEARAIIAQHLQQGLKPTTPTA